MKQTRLESKRNSKFQFLKQKFFLPPQVDPEVSPNVELEAAKVPPSVPPSWISITRTHSNSGKIYIVLSLPPPDCCVIRTSRAGHRHIEKGEFLVALNASFTSTIGNGLTAVYPFFSLSRGRVTACCSFNFNG